MPPAEQLAPLQAAKAPPPLDVFNCALEGSTLIEASAGTGKTWNICGLVLRLLLERRLEVQNILVVTFTNAATAELRERIRSRLVQTLARLRSGGAAADGAGTATAPVKQSITAPMTAPLTAPDPFVDPLLQALRQRGLRDADMALQLDLALQTFDEASIFTIHGFCQRALADAAFSAGLPLQQALQADDSALRLRVVHDFWRRHLAGPALQPALAAYLAKCADSPERHAKLLQRQLAKPLSKLIWPEDLDGEPGPGGHNDATTLALAALQTVHGQAQACWAEQRETVVDLVSRAWPGLNKTRFKPDSLAAAAAQWDQVFAQTQTQTQSQAQAEARFVSAAIDKLHLLTPPALLPNKGQPAVAPHPFFALAEAWLAQHSSLQQALEGARLRLLRALLSEGPPALADAKREARLLAFDDLLVNLHQRLSGPAGEALAASLRQRYPAALVDEFQDTDPLQFAIFRKLYGTVPTKAPLFLVGDPKQAIYSFRNADLHTYLQARAQANREATLSENQRSVPALVDALNALFTHNPRAFVLEGLVAHPVATGAKPREQLWEAGPARAALQLWALPCTPQGQPWPKAEALHIAAVSSANEIARLLAAALAGQVKLGQRAAAASDIAVLVRSHAQGARMRQALQAVGVASVELSQASVFDSVDAEELERVLVAVLEPTSEVLLRAALATAWLGEDAGCINSLAADQQRLSNHAQRLAALRPLWLQRGVGVMLRRLALDWQVHARLLARPDGERRLTNLLHLAENLQQAALEHAGPEAQLRWLQTQRAEAGSTADSSQLRLESDQNLVQIVTIHKSKGLEYPFVFCPFLWDGHPGGRTPAGDGSDGLEYHDPAQGGAVIDFRLLPEKSPLAQAIKQQRALDKAAENLRLVYVALTRAVQRCHVVVGPYGAGPKGQSPNESARSPLQWLVGGAGRESAELLKLNTDAATQTAAWAQFASQHRGCVAWGPLPPATGPGLAPGRPAATSVAALAPPRHIPAAWRMGSYSSLSQGAAHEAAAADHDTRLQAAPGLFEAGAEDPSEPDPQAEGAFESGAATESGAKTVTVTLTATATATETENQAEPTAVATALPDDDILHFPRGAAAGECLHRVFENIDFSDSSGWPAAVEQALALLPASPPRAGAAATENPASPPPALAPQVLRMLQDVLHTPLLPGLRLADVQPTRRLIELEFTLPAPQLSARVLQNLMRDAGYPVPALAFGQLQGYLRGFIDLVFEHQGRFHVLDWKSSHLGTQVESYASESLARAMDSQGYHLQYLLYTVALHRHLQQRLPGYRYEQHMGEVLYLFVRGVRPGWRDAQGAACGVFAHRPAWAVVAKLAALLAPQPPGPGVQASALGESC